MNFPWLNMLLTMRKDTGSDLVVPRLDATGAIRVAIDGAVAGPQGDPGSVWHSGSGAPAGGLGVETDYYLDTANGDVYEKTGVATWTLVGNIEGPQGPQGPPGGLTLPIVTVATNYNITIADGTVLVDASSGPLVITLPTALSSDEYRFTVKKIDDSNNIVTVDGSGVELIDGSQTFVIVSQYEAISVHSDGAQFWIV